MNREEAINDIAIRSHLPGFIVTEALDALAAALKASDMCMLPDGSFKPLDEIYSLAKFAPFPEAVR